MPRKSAGKAASNLHKLLLSNLKNAFAAKGLNLKEGMESVGASEQLYNQWQNGASPQLLTMEKIADKLEISVSELLGGLRPAFLSAQSAEIASHIDNLPESAREAIVNSVRAQALLYRAGAVRTPERPTRSNT